MYDIGSIPFILFIEESYITQMEYGVNLHDVEIIDTAGQEEFMSFRNSSLSKGDAFLGLFAIDSISSWYDLQELRTKLLREKDDDHSIPMVIIANKSVSSCNFLFILNCANFNYWLYL